MLSQWRITTDGICLYCDKTDDLQHHFWFCPATCLFWNSFNNWWAQFCKNCNAADIKDVMLGNINEKCHYVQLNYTILCCKWYIYRVKYLEKELFFLNCLTFIKDKLLMEKMIYSSQRKMAKFDEQWADILNAL